MGGANGPRCLVQFGYRELSYVTECHEQSCAYEEGLGLRTLQPQQSHSTYHTQRRGHGARTWAMLCCRYVTAPHATQLWLKNETWQLIKDFAANVASVVHQKGSSHTPSARKVHYFRERRAKRSGTALLAGKGGVGEHVYHTAYQTALLW